MNKKILKKLSSLYDDIYSPIPYHQNKTKMVSFVIYKNKILCFGVNSERTSPIQHYYRVRTKDANKDYIYDKLHAEIDCIGKLPRGFSDFKKAELVIVSKMKNGNFRLAKPCPICRTMIEQYEFKNIYYTTYENKFVKEIDI